MKELLVREPLSTGQCLQILQILEKSHSATQRVHDRWPKAIQHGLDLLPGWCEGIMKSSKNLSQVIHSKNRLLLMSLPSFREFITSRPSSWRNSTEQLWRYQRWRIFLECNGPDRSHDHILLRVYFYVYARSLASSSLSLPWISVPDTDHPLPQVNPPCFGRGLSHWVDFWEQARLDYSKGQGRSGTNRVSE
jgi:hypothetical protein